MLFLQPQVVQLQLFGGDFDELLACLLLVSSEVALVLSDFPRKCLYHAFLGKYRVFLASNTLLDALAVPAYFELQVVLTLILLLPESV